MNLFLSLAVCFVPLVLIISLCVIFIKGFKVFYALCAIILGFVAIFLIIVVRTMADDFFNFIPFALSGFFAVVLSTLFYAFIEESVKMLLLVLLPKKIATLKNFMLSCMILGCTVGCAETLMYLVSGYTGTISRLFTAVIIHTLCALLSGYLIWALKSKLVYIGPFFMSVLLHGLYNYFALQTSSLRWFSIVILLFSLLRCRVNYVNVKEKLESLGVSS